jgi:predicted GIY-YIG superfamily endonuclease
VPKLISPSMAKLANQPHALYRFFDRADTLLYVGITMDLPKRLQSHQRDKAWWHRVANMKAEHYPTRKAALAAEAVAIREERPLFNDQHNGLVPAEEAFADLSTHEKIRLLSSAERDVIAIPAYEDGQRDLATAILEYVYDEDADMPGIRRRVARRPLEDRYSDETVEMAVAAMDQATDYVTSLEYALQNLLHAFPREAQARHERYGRQDVAEFYRDDHTEIDILARTAYYARNWVFASTLDRLTGDQQTEWLACAHGMLGEDADPWLVRAKAGQMAQVYAEEFHVLHPMCWADAGRWAKCPNRATFTVWPEGECLECGEQDGNPCRGHDVFCAEHLTLALDRKLTARPGDRLLAQRTRIGRHEVVSDPWAGADLSSVEPPF